MFEPTKQYALNRGTKFKRGSRNQCVPLSMFLLHRHLQKLKLRATWLPVVFYNFLPTETDQKPNRLEVYLHLSLVIASTWRMFTSLFSFVTCDNVWAFLRVWARSQKIAIQSFTKTRLLLCNNSLPSFRRICNNKSCCLKSNHHKIFLLGTQKRVFFQKISKAFWIVPCS